MIESLVSSLLDGRIPGIEEAGIKQLLGLGLEKRMLVESSCCYIRVFTARIRYMPFRIPSIPALMSWWTLFALFGEFIKYTFDSIALCFMLC